METLQLIQRKLVYNEWANRRALESLQAMDTLSSRGVRALSHVLLVEKLWLARLRREEMKLPPEFFPALRLPECSALIDENLNGYQGYLGVVTEQGLDAVQDFQTIKGDKYRLSIRDVLTHVMMHSMYHRGQVSLAIREDGGEPLQSDYSLFMRETSD
ncbi:MAG TPA: DinB family protein [Pyrinomonadaceae bacterium]